MKKYQGILVTGGVINCLIGLLHLIIPFIGPSAYIFFGAGEVMAAMAATNPIIPGVITSLLGLVFITFGLYAFSGAGLIKRLPMLHIGLAAIGGIFMIRGLIIPLDVFFFLTDKPSIRYAGFSLVALIVGFLYLWPTTHSWSSLKTTEVKTAD